MHHRKRHVITIIIQPVHWRTLHGHTANTSRDSYLLLCDVTADMENTASFILVVLDRVYKAGNVMIKSVTTENYNFACGSVWV
jgi:hypothetical protein